MIQNQALSRIAYWEKHQYPAYPEIILRLSIGSHTKIRID